MYLNGNRLREAARLRKMSKDDLQKKSGLDKGRIAYHWNNSVTVTNQDEIDALGKALGINGTVLLIEGEPDVIALPSNKFSTEEDE